MCHNQGDQRLRSYWTVPLIRAAWALLPAAHRWPLNATERPRWPTAGRPTPSEMAVGKELDHRSDLLLGHERRHVVHGWRLDQAGLGVAEERVGQRTRSHCAHVVMLLRARR